MARKDITLYIGETWTVQGVAGDSAGDPVDLTAGSIEFRMASQEASVLKLISGPDTQVQITDPAAGAYEITVQPDDAKQAVLPGQYIYEVVSVTAATGVTVQNRGIANVYRSLRKQFP